MQWSIASAKQVVGIPDTDTSKDTSLQRALDYTLASVEQALGRGLFLRRELVEFFDACATKLFVPRYPIQQVHSVDGDPNACTVVHQLAGWVALRRARGPHVTLDYTGGYSTLPFDLEGAMWDAFALRWSQLDAVTGFPANPGGSTVTQGSGEVSRVTIADFGSVSFDVGTSVSNGTSSASDLSYWGWLAPWAPILASYRRVAGAALAVA